MYLCIIIHRILLLRGVNMDKKQADLNSFEHYRCLESVEKSQHDLYLCYCGQQDCHPGHFFGPTIRNDYLLHIVTSGKGTYTINNTTYKLKKNDIFLIYPGVTTYYEADTDDPWSYIWFGFNGLKAEMALRYAGLSLDIPVATIPDITPYVNDMNGLLDACQLTFSNEFRREAYLYSLVAQLGEDLHTEDNRSPEFGYSYETYVNHALDYIENNYYRNIKITDIADYIGINRSYLTSCFKKRMNMSPHQYLLEYRLSKAKILLRETNKTIQEIAGNVGYEDSLAFSKIFKSHTGISPKSYRDTNNK